MMLNLNNIYPVVSPAQYYSKEWDLPHYKLPDAAFILTWVVFDEEEAGMEYLTRDEYQYLAKTHKGWQQKTFENLRQSLAEDENFFTQYQLSDDGQRIILLAFMQNDGIGSSRILLSEELEAAFPHGYYLAFPDRCCGLVISKDVTNPELQEIRSLVRHMFETANIPMSDQLYASEGFTVPGNWTQPIDYVLSNLLVSGVSKLREAL
ncbi:hypothetical protein ABZR88_13825 [Mucilaginibacter yixingensis]|nr:hypothetical protein [Mucilaginibacter yixingensis]